MLTDIARQDRSTQKGAGIPATAGRTKWVQTERAAHEEWAALTRANPSASSLLHTLVARMEQRNILVIPLPVLAELLACSVATVKRAVKYLREHNWIQVIQVGGKGGVNAYVVNSLVAWSEKRELLGMATFTAQVVASAADQSRAELPVPLQHRQLRRIPMVVTREDLIGPQTN